MPLAYGLRCAQVPSFRSRSVGPPPRAIHGPSRLSRHPCRSTHSTEPPLGLPMGRVDQDQKLARRPTGRPVGVSVCCAIFVVAEERSEAAIGCEAVAKSDTRFFQIAPGLRFYGRFATSLRSSAARGKQLSRVHIRHLHLTAILVSPLRRVPFVKQPSVGTPQKYPKRPCPVVRPSLRSGVPHSGPAPWARRDVPSMAHRGSPGIHAGRPTAQNLLSASRRASRSKADQKRPCRAVLLFAFKGHAPAATG